jgi:hypothetical protein
MPKGGQRVRLVKKTLGGGGVNPAQSKEQFTALADLFSQLFQPEEAVRQPPGVSGPTTSTPTPTQSQSQSQKPFSPFSALSDGFAGILDPTIIYPKLIQLRDAHKRIFKVYELFLKNETLENIIAENSILEGQFESYTEFVKEYEEWLATLDASLTDLGNLESMRKENVTLQDLLSSNAKYQYKKEDIVKLQRVYLDTEKSDYTNVAIEYYQTLQTIGVSKNISFEDICADKKLRWINSLTDMKIELFSFSTLDAKMIYNSKVVDPEEKELFDHYCFAIYTKLAKYAKDILDIIVQPNINIGMFSGLVIANLATFRKEIPRCDQAFDKIEQTLTTLEKNFPRYYKEYIRFRDPTLILENFLKDICAETDNDPKLIFQLKKIINYFLGKLKGNHMYKENQNFSKFLDKITGLLELESIHGSNTKPSPNKKQVTKSENNDEENNDEENNITNNVEENNNESDVESIADSEHDDSEHDEDMM